jgi:hypothetical protein
MDDSSHFQLNDQRGALRAEVTPRSVSRTLTGIWTLSAGGGLTFLGTLGCVMSSGESGSKSLFLASAGVGVAGLIAIATGVYLMATSHTRYELKPAAF